MKSKLLLFASGNAHKLSEIKDLLRDTDYEVKGLADLSIFEEIPENGKTLEENAFLKAQYLFERTGLPVLAEDTGLEVHALNGAPGVITARYAGEQKNPVDNMQKLLNELQNANDRSARFRTVIVWYDGIDTIYFEGIVNGSIGFEPEGSGGFGYDPVFIPDGSSMSFASMDKTSKNEISHRARAINALLDYLKNND